jgi:Fe2+ or Zn2+ uptake regulation protein
MVQLESDSNWLKRGRQRCAVAQVLRRPMTPSEIWRAAQGLAPRIQLRDVWFILQQMQQRRLVTCFNPKELTGKVYYWTKVRDSPTHNWGNYAFVVRAKVRRLVLTQLARRPSQPATLIRRAINERQPVTLNAVIRALRNLHRRKLVRVVGEGAKRGQKLYRLTQTGENIAGLLALRTESPQTFLTPASSVST